MEIIVEQGKSDARLIDEKELSDTIINCLPGIFYLQDEYGKYLRWNRNFEIVSGFDKEEIPHIHPLVFFDESVHERMRAGAKKVFAEGHGEIEVEIIRRNGEKRLFYLNGYPVNYGGKICLLGSGIDLTPREKARQELQKSEEKYRSIFELASDAIMVTDFEGQFITVNESLCKMLGYSQKELLRMNIAQLIDPAQLKQRPIPYKQLKMGKHVFSERRLLHKDGSVVITEANIKKIDENSILSIARNVTVIRELQRKMDLDMIEHKVQEQKKIIRAVIKAQERERNKIGQELHDNINQLLASIRMCVFAARKSPKSRESYLTKGIELIDHTIQAIRQLSKKQITPLKGFHLKEQTQSLIDSLHDIDGLDIAFTYDVPEGAEPSDDLKLNIYRIIQEQLTNIHKHASAKTVSISITVKAGFIYVHIKDNGKGFLTAKKRKGIGILNITNRVHSYNGILSISSAPQQGCIIDIQIPLTAA
jgi:PAS domain S-box-containing protein